MEIPNESLKGLKEWFFNTYFDKFTEEDRTKIKELFKLWITELIREKSQFYNIFEVLHKHENQEVKKICLNAVKNFLPTERIIEFILYWIYDPIKELENIVNELVNTRKNLLPKGLLCLYLLSIQKFEELEEIDPNLQELNQYLQNLDKNFARPLLEKFNNYLNRDSISFLKNFRYFHTSEDFFNDSSILDKIERSKLSKDWQKIWQACKFAPIPLSADLLKTLLKNNWNPNNQNDKELFDCLKECWGDKGWQGIKNLTNLIINSLDKELNTSLNNQIQINSQIFINPNKFIVDFDPFYSPNDDCLTQIPEYDLYLLKNSIYYFKSLKIFNFSFHNKKSEEIIEFTIKNSDLIKESIDINNLMTHWEPQTKRLVLYLRESSFLINIHLINVICRPLVNNLNLTADYLNLNEKLNKIELNYYFLLKGITELLKRNVGYPNKLIKEPYSIEIFDEKRILISEDKKKTFNIGIDFGHSSTTIVVLDYNNNIKRLNLSSAINNQNESDPGNLIPSIIHFNDINDYVIGKKALKKSEINDSNTFNKMKRYINEGFRQVRIINGKEINASEAALKFIFSIFEEIFEQIKNEDLNRIVFTIPINSSPEYEAWMKQTIDEISKIYDINKSQFIIIKEGLAACFDINSEKEIETPIVVIDVGAQTSDIAVIDIKGKDSEELLVYSSVGDELGGDDIDRIIYEYLIKEFIEIKTKFNFDKYKERLFHECEIFKKELSYDKKIKIVFPSKIKEYIKNPEISISLTREKVEELLYDNEFYRKFAELLENSINQAEKNLFNFDNLNSIILIGGAAQWPGIKEFIENQYPNRKIFSERFQFITALGAAKFLPELKLNNRTRYDYGIILSNYDKKDFYELIPKNTKVPFDLKTWKLVLNPNLSHFILDIWRRRDLSNVYKEKKEIFYDERGYLYFKQRLKENILYESLITSPIIIDIDLKSNKELYLSLKVSNNLQIQLKIHDLAKPEINTYFELDNFITIS